MAVGLLALTPDLDFPSADKEFRQVLQSSPGNAAAKNALSLSLMAQGRLTEAEEACRQAISLDPLLNTLWFNLGRIMAGTGRYKEAEEGPGTRDLSFNQTQLVFTLTSPCSISCKTGLTRRWPTHNWRHKASGATTQLLWCKKHSVTDLQSTPRSWILLPSILAIPFRLLCSTLFERSRTQCLNGSIPPMPRTTPVSRSSQSRLSSSPITTTHVSPHCARSSASSCLQHLQSRERAQFFTEVKRRNAYKVAAVYAVVAWLLLQVASRIFPFCEIHNWVLRLVVFLLITGFPIAVIPASRNCSRK